MEELLVKREPIVSEYLVLTTLVEPSNEDRGVLQSFQHVLTQQSHQLTYLIDVH